MYLAYHQLFDRILVQNLLLTYDNVSVNQYYQQNIPTQDCQQFLQPKYIQTTTTHKNARYLKFIDNA